MSKAKYRIIERMDQTNPFKFRVEQLDEPSEMWLPVAIFPDHKTKEGAQDRIAELVGTFRVVATYDNEGNLLVDVG